VASALHVFTHPDSAQPVLGASGAVFALAARGLMPRPRARITRWSDMYDRRTRGRRVPDIRPSG